MPHKTKKLNKENLQLRVPRPLGLTYQMMNINKQENDIVKQENLKRIKITLIDQWVSASMRLNDRIYTIEQMSQYLNMTIAEITKYIWKAMGKVGRVIGKRDAGEIAREIFGGAIFKSLEIQALMAQQVSLLMKSQGDSYKPFISATVNQALANLNATQASSLALLKVLTDKQETNIIINNVGTSRGTQYLTSETALKLISNEQNGNAIEDKPIEQKLLEFSPYDIVPDTNPRTQDTKFLSTPKMDKSATSHINPLPIKAVGPGMGLKKDSRPTNHEDRRQKAEGIMDIENEDDYIM